MTSVLFYVIIILASVSSRENRKSSKSNVDVLKFQLDETGVSDIKDIIDGSDATKIVALIKTNGSLDEPINRKNSRYVCSRQRCNTVCRVWKYEGGVCKDNNVCTCLMSMVEKVDPKPVVWAYKKKKKKTTPSPFDYFTAAPPKRKVNKYGDALDVYIANQVKRKLKKHRNDENNRRVHQVGKTHTKIATVKKSFIDDDNGASAFPLDIYEYITKEKKVIQLNTPPPDSKFDKFLEDHLKGTHSHPRKIPKLKKTTTKLPEVTETSENEEEEEKDESEGTSESDDSSKSDDSSTSDDSGEGDEPSSSDISEDDASAKKPKKKEHSESRKSLVKGTREWKLQKLKQLKEVIENSEGESLDRRPHVEKIKEILKVGDDISASYLSRRKKDTNPRRPKVQPPPPLSFNHDEDSENNTNSQHHQWTNNKLPNDRLPRYSLSNYGHASSIQRYAHDFECGKDAPI